MVAPATMCSRDTAAYERYTNENINKFNFTGYPTVHLPTLENYWEGDEMGLAEFVNRNFRQRRCQRRRG